MLHWAGIPECIADLHALFPKAFAIVDRVVGMEGNGPIKGTRAPQALVVAGASPMAVDATCCRIMGLDPTRIRYLQLAAGQQNLGQELIPQHGERIASVATRFAVLPGLEGFALASLNCKRQTNIGRRKLMSREAYAESAPRGKPRAHALSAGAERILVAVVALLLLIPCFWQPHIMAGDLSSPLLQCMAGPATRTSSTISTPQLTLAHPVVNVLSRLGNRAGSCYSN